jgi:hypothetical protein
MAKQKARTKNKNEVIVTFIKHYDEEDVEFRSDYYDSEILVNDVLLVNTGGYDSDFRDPVAYFEGFVEGLKFMDKRLNCKLELLQVETQRKADYKGV